MRMMRAIRVIGAAAVLASSLCCTAIDAWHPLAISTRVAQQERDAEASDKAMRSAITERNQVGDWTCGNGAPACAAGFVCVAEGDDYGVCRPACTSQNDCREGVCMLVTDSTSACRPEPP
jgi:hypothetical protein